MIKIVCFVNNYQYGENRFKRLRELYQYDEEFLDSNHHLVWLEIPDETLRFVNSLLNADIHDNVGKANHFSRQGWIAQYKRRIKDSMDINTDKLGEKVLNEILALNWDESEENTEKPKNLQNLLEFGWNLVRKLYDMVREMNKIVSNNIDYNRTAKKFYVSGLGGVEYREIDKYKQLANALYPLAGAIANELKETKATGLCKPSFREFLLTIYQDIFQSRGIVDSIKKTLNPKLWDENNHLKQDIKEQIEKVVDKYKEWLEEEDISIDIEDVIVIGSNASYTYTGKSDLDVHIIVNCNDEMLMKLYDAFKTLFNDTYNIKFNNINVELYVQNDMSDLTSKGIYSIYKGWLKEPVKEEINENDISDDFKELEKEYNEVNRNPSLDNVSKLINKIYALRRSGLDEEGEYSKNNQLFKEFRRKGYLEKLKTLKIKLETDEMSFKDSLKDEIIATMSEEEIKKYRNYGNPKIFFLCSEHSDCAGDHIEGQGKMYVDANWRSAFNPSKEKAKINAIDKYIKEHNIKTIQSVMGEPTFLTTRPYCRHTFKSLTADDVISNSYSKPASIHNSKRGK